MTEFRAITKEEARLEFLEELKLILNYWSGSNASSLPLKERVEGAIFSTLVLIDGGRDFPAINLTLDPHPEYKQYRIVQGENYYEGICINDDTQLHEEWCAFLNKEKK